MIFELIGTIAAGFAAAGVALAINHLFGKKLPRWIVPASAGLAMLSFTIFNEYSWFPRTSASLPEGVEVAHTVTDAAFYRPWTYMWPYVDRFIAVDQASMRLNEDVPDQRMLDLIVYGRWTSAKRVKAVFDCKNGRRADVTGAVKFTEDGDLAGATWHDTGLEHPVTKQACE